MTGSIAGGPDRRLLDMLILDVGEFDLRFMILDGFYEDKIGL